MSMTLIVLLISVLVILSGFFSGSELALVSADRLKLRSDAEAGRGGAVIALKMLEQPTRMLGTCLVGTNLCAISIATLGTGLVLDLTTIPPSLAFLLVALFTLTICEMVPKAVYQHHADALVPYVVYLLRFLSIVLTICPLVLRAGIEPRGR